MKIRIISIICMASLLLASCSDWLDVKPEGAPSNDNSWKTDADYKTVAVSLYSCFSMEDTWGSNLFWEQGASDDIFFSRSQGNAEMNLANLAPDGVTESSLPAIYKEMYRTMSVANDIIYHALKMENRSAIINRTLGEAYFMRAFAHFMIAYRYGRQDNGVPFIRYELFKDYDKEKTQIPKQEATVMDNYALIEDDLDKAFDLLPWFSEYGADDYGRPTKQAALGYKVKTFAYWAQFDPSKWNEIPALVDKLENEGGRGLLDNFADVFKIDNEWGKEHIWSVNSSGAEKAGSMFPGVMLDNKGWGRYNGWGYFKPTLELWAEYDDNDQRRAATIMQYGDPFVFFGEKRRFYSTADLECGFHFMKYMEPFTYGSVDALSGAGISSRLSPSGDRPTTDLNIPLIRFAEMLLFKAEAQIETGNGAGAAKTLDRLTRRAGMGDVYTNATIEDLMHERRCELAGEFTDRTMDLKRWAAKYPAAKQKLEAAKHGLKYTDRSNPDSPLDTVNGTSMTINGKQYKGVIEIMQAKQYDAATYCVLPYEINEVIKAKGALKQNHGYNSY